MADNRDLIQKLEKAIPKVEAEVKSCHKANEDFLKNKGTPGGAGSYRGPLPNDCSIPENELARLRDDLARAKAGKDHIPDPMSPRGRDLVKRIEDRLETGSLLAKTILFGTALSYFDTMGIPFVATGGHDLVDTTEAMGSVPAIVRGRNADEINLHLTATGLSPQEQKYWNEVLKQMGK